MRAMILAAGRGERMRPLTDYTPKPLLKVGGKALIVWHIENLAQAGFKDIVINHAHLWQHIELGLGDGSQWGVAIHYSGEAVYSETSALETAGGIANALPLLCPKGEENAPFLVVNGDIFTDINFANLHLSAPNVAHLVMVENPPQHPQGDFALKGGKLHASGDNALTFSGVGVYHPRLFAEIARGSKAKLAPLLKAAMSQDLVTGVQHHGQWYDIGTPERLQQLNANLEESTD